MQRIVCSGINNAGCPVGRFKNSKRAQAESIRFRWLREKSWFYLFWTIMDILIGL